MYKRRSEFTGYYVPHARVRADVGGPSLTRQEFADECDINTIMAKYETTGTISHFNDGQPQYLDLTDFPETLEGTLSMLMEAEDAFMRLPARVRREFDNDPVRFVEYAGDPANLDQMRAWDLAPPAPPPAPPISSTTPEPKAD